MIDGQVTPVEGSNLSVQFLGNANNANNATSAQDYLSTLEQVKGAEKTTLQKYFPVIIGSTTGLVSTYTMVQLWPERKTIGLALFGGGLWSAYKGFRMGRS